MDPSPPQPPIRVAWDDAIVDLAGCGWTRAEGAVDLGLVGQLAAEDGSQWRLLGDEGVARQHAFGTYLSFDRTRPAVRQLGEELILRLSEAAEHRGLPGFPRFNEVTWTRYPPREGRISRHRDPSEYGGAIAVFTVEGSARFRIFGPDDEVVEWEATPGQLVLLRGAGWPSEAHRCPPHEVDPPAGGERVILTMRTNSNGAGGGYVV